MSASNCCPSVPGRSTSLTPESPTTTIPKQRSRAGRNPKSLRTSKVTLTKINREGGSELQLCTCLTFGNKFGIKAEQSDFYWTLNLLKGDASSRGNAVSTEQPCLTPSLLPRYSEFFPTRQQHQLPLVSPKRNWERVQRLFANISVYEIAFNF